MASFFQADSCGGFAGAFELGISEVGRADLGTEAPKQAEAYFGEAEGTTGGSGDGVLRYSGDRKDHSLRARGVVHSSFFGLVPVAGSVGPAL